MAVQEWGSREVIVGNVPGVSGEANIAGRDIYKWYPPEHVSALLQQITLTFQPKPFDRGCPSKGMNVFEEEDADITGAVKAICDEQLSLAARRTNLAAEWIALTSSTRAKHSCP